MSLAETRSFLEELVLRFDPSLDTTSGSRVQSELINPILERIGPDPFDEDMVTFIRARIQQVFPTLAITDADELTDLLIDPMRVLLEPLVREVKLIKLRVSLRNQDSLSDDEIDALMGNFFEPRKSGGYSIGTIRVYYSSPQTVSLTLTNVATSKSGLRFLVTRPQLVTAEQMLLNVEGSEYYADFNYTAENRGTEYDVEEGEINSIANLPTATRVKNVRRFSGGVPREDNATYVARVQQGTSDKTLTTQPGIVAVLNEAFPELQRVFSVGFGEPEMQRDVVTGGGLGVVPEPDTNGNFFGTAVPADDLDGDATSPLLECATGSFVNRIGAVNRTPDGWYLSVTYVDPNTTQLVAADAAVLEVQSSTRIRIDHEFPLELEADSVVWVLRRNELTITSIPGGIALPDSADGTLAIRAGEVHIGGKTDVYVAGTLELLTAQITGVSDMLPVAKGIDAQTQGSTGGSEDIVILDIDEALEDSVLAGMSLILTEGSDAGSYRILQVLSSPFRVRVDTDMTGTQTSLSWRIVDEIDLDLVTPRNILAEGDDAVLAVGSSTVTTTSGFNWIDAGVRVDDVASFGTDSPFEALITNVTATELTIEPGAPYTVPASSFEVSRRSPGLLRPVVRVQSMELLDDSGAPNGTQIPFRDPVAVLSRSFQNEGAGYLFDGFGITGLVSQGMTGDQVIGSLGFGWEVRELDRIWDMPADEGTFTFSSGDKDVGEMVDEINGNAGLTGAGVRAVELTYNGQSYLGFTCPRQLRLVTGSALTVLGITAGWSNSMIRGFSSTLLTTLKVRTGDLVEFVGTNNAGVALRVVKDPEDENGSATLGLGPSGPAGTSGLFDNSALRPDVGSRFRIGRPSIGSVRAYYLAPTSAEFRYATTRFSVETGGSTLIYRPDPENTRTVIPAPPTTTLPDTGSTNYGAGTLTDASTNFLLQGITPGDLLDILYVPILGTTALGGGSIAVNGLTLILRFDEDAYTTIAFPYSMVRADVVSYINAQTGTTVARLVSNKLELRSSRRIEISSASTALGVLFLDTLTSTHTQAGTYIVASVSENQLTVATETPFSTSGNVTDTHYRVRRHTQRISSTEMNLNADPSGLYYVDVQSISMLPGDQNNIGTDLEMVVSGHLGDGYRLLTSNSTTSYSRAEELQAKLSRTILLVGSSDSPEEYVQLSEQNIQVTYERSAMVDAVQSFCDSAFRRVLCEEILVRHLLPHYVSTNWSYAGGSNEATVTRALIDFLDSLQSGEELEVLDLVDVVKRLQASSVFTPDPSVPSGRSSPLALVLRHEADRTLRASLVRDAIDLVRTQYYVADNLRVRRLSSAGVR